MERLRGGAGPLFSDSGPGASRLVRVLSVDAPALVLGSTQRTSVVSVSEVDVVRRRSGGGAVLLRPDETVWVDVVVPAGDRLWTRDVGRSFEWVGAAWASALASLGLGGLSVHRGAFVRTRWSGDVCFAGVGSGEVLAADGRKVVGMASHRTRDRALFQCAVPLTWDPDAYVRLLRLPASAAADLAAATAPVVGVRGDDLVAAFLASLP
ncbi:MAG TPA: hypothetical protein VM143_10600 [Acidimicrobiales bacterium]|nr:hypothetical protein [Acidimicrobiales bacterium]